MPRKVRLPQSPHHVMIYDEDWVYLEGLFGRHNGPQAVGTSAAIRRMVHSWCQRMRAREEQLLAGGEAPTLDEENEP
jgi:hypothetical protein